MKIKFKKLNDNAVIPAYQTKGSAGADLVSVEEKTLIPGETAMVSTGFSMEIPDGYEVQIRPRSGLAAKHSITVTNSPGTVDSDFRGEVKVILTNLGKADFTIKPGDRVAQMVVAKVEQPEFELVDELSETERGEGGFGSTGKSGESNKTFNPGFVYETTAKLATFLEDNGLKMSGDELVDFLNRNGAEKPGGGRWRKGRGIFSFLRSTYDLYYNEGYPEIAENISNAFVKKYGGLPWE